VIHESLNKSQKRMCLLKKTFVETYRISKTFNAPLGFVYKWCTDYQPDDPKMIGSKNRRNILERSKRNVIWRVQSKSKVKGYEGVRAVWLKPPNAWHLDTCGDGREVGDYKLTRLSKTRTRLDMKFQVTYNYAGQIESKKSWIADLKSHWDSYGRYLEKDYRRHIQSR
jgi:hypothetical protein